MLSRIEKQLKRRFAIGSQVSEHSIIQDFTKQVGLAGAGRGGEGAGVSSWLPWPSSHPQHRSPIAQQPGWAQLVLVPDLFPSFLPLGRLFAYFIRGRG